MAPVTYYYLFSILLAVTPLFWLINLVYLKKKGRTILGQVYPIGTPDYKSIVKKLANRRNILITIVITLLALINLAWSIVTVTSVNTSNAQLLLVAAPIVILIAWAFMMTKARKEYGTNSSGKESYKKAPRKHTKDDDSWLS